MFIFLSFDNRPKGSNLTILKGNLEIIDCLYLQYDSVCIHFYTCNLPRFAIDVGNVTYFNQININLPAISSIQDKNSTTSPT